MPLSDCRCKIFSDAGGKTATVAFLGMFYKKKTLVSYFSMSVPPSPFDASHDKRLTESTTEHRPEHRNEHRPEPRSLPERLPRREAIQDRSVP